MTQAVTSTRQRWKKATADLPKVCSLGLPWYDMMLSTALRHSCAARVPLTCQIWAPEHHHCRVRNSSAGTLGCVCAGSLGAHTVALGQAAREAAAPDDIHGAVERAPARHLGARSYAGWTPETCVQSTAARRSIRMLIWHLWHGGHSIACRGEAALKDYLLGMGM